MLQNDSNSSQKSIPLQWYQWGIDYLDSKGIDEETYRNRTIKPRLLKALATPYTLSLVDQASPEALQRLQLSRSTTDRWLKNETQPHGEVFFGVLLIVLQKDITDVSHPSRNTAVLEGFKRTLTITRHKECDQDLCLPRTEEIAFLRQLLRDKRFSPTTLATADGHQAIHDAILHFDRVSRHTTRWTMKSAQRTIGEWLLPFVLLRIGILPGWSDI